MIIPVPQAGQHGLVVDLPFNELPLNAWTAARNVRFKDGAVEKFRGQIEVYASPLVAPYWLLPVIRGGSYQWLYAGTAKVGATDGATHADITRTSGGDYTTDLSIGWTGTVLEGVPVINNGFDAPQMWNPAALATPLAALTAWPASTTARAMRSLKRYLVALDITKSVTRYPNMIKWSDAAPTGNVPTSWDETDETRDAGEWTLSSEGGFLIDAFPIRDALMVYKEYQSHLMTYVGGNDIFRFTKKFDSFGSLSRKCAIEFFNGKQIVFTGEDCVLHDGDQAKSIMDARTKNLLNGVIDSTYYQRSFVVANYPTKEIWVCIPETGQSTPTLALVWNWLYDTWSVRQIPNAAFISAGIVSPLSAGDVWSGDPNSWGSDVTAWGDRSFDPSRRNMLMALPGTTKLMQPEQTQQFDGVDMNAYVERQGIGFPLKKDGPPDYTTMKQIRSVWPRITGTQGGVINVYLGTQAKINGAVSWQAARSFTIGMTEFVDTASLPTAKLHAIKFESTGNIEWKLHGYDADVVARGRYG